jgi:hypothetical protein
VVDFICVAWSIEAFRCEKLDDLQIKDKLQTAAAGVEARW